jgi:hypothetical protein
MRTPTTGTPSEHCSYTTNEPALCRVTIRDRIRPSNWFWTLAHRLVFSFFLFHSIWVEGSATIRYGVQSAPCKAARDVSTLYYESWAFLSYFFFPPYLVQVVLRGYTTAVVNYIRYIQKLSPALACKSRVSHSRRKNKKSRTYNTSGLEPETIWNRKPAVSTSNPRKLPVNTREKRRIKTLSAVQIYCWVFAASISIRTLTSPSIQSTVSADKSANTQSFSFWIGTRPSGSQALTFHAAGSLDASSCRPGYRRRTDCLTESTLGHWPAGRSSRGKMRLPRERTLIRR